MTSEATHSAISLPESEDGHTHLSLQAWLQTVLYGQEAAPASLSAQPVHAKASTTSATSGPNSSASSLSASLQSCLESKLRRRMEGCGSQLYALIWKHWDMESGPPICALRASARPTSDKDFSGWPTPAAHDHRIGYQRRREGKKGSQLNMESIARDNFCRQIELTTDGFATHVGWGSSMDVAATTGSGCASNAESGPTHLSMTQTTDANIADQTRLERRTVFGDKLTGSEAATASGIQLNPAHFRWVMGFPPAWSN